MRCTVVDGEAALDCFDQRWDDLLSRTGLPNPLLSAVWLRALARWERTAVPLVGLVEVDGMLLAAAALEVRRPGGRLGPRVAGWLGPQAQQHSPDFLVDALHPEAGEALARALFEDVDVLSLDTAESGSAARALAAVAPWRSVVPAWERWLLRVPPPRLDYVRKQVAYDLRRAARLGADIEVRVVSEPAEVERALLEFFRVHRDRWRDRADQEPRFATSHAYRRWNLRAITEMAALGRARLIEVVEGGRPVAGSLGFVQAGGAVGHTTATRVGGALRQPGHLAALTRTEALAAAGATVIDLGRGSGDPGGSKLRLGPDPDPLVFIFAAATPRRQHGYNALRHIRAHLGRKRPHTQPGEEP